MRHSRSSTRFFFLHFLFFFFSFFLFLFNKTQEVCRYIFLVFLILLFIVFFSLFFFFFNFFDHIALILSRFYFFSFVNTSTSFLFTFHQKYESLTNRTKKQTLKAFKHRSNEQKSMNKNLKNDIEMKIYAHSKSAVRILRKSLNVCSYNLTYMI